jgi:hypothetical protein
MRLTMKKLGVFNSLLGKGPLAAVSAVILSAVCVAPVLARDVFYTTGGAGGGTTEFFTIKVNGNKITTTDVGPMNAGDCGSLALSPSGTLYSVCGVLFGTQELATVDPKTGVATILGIGVPGLAVMSLAIGPTGILYAVGDCNPDSNFECNTQHSPPDPNFNSLYTVDTTSGAFNRVGPTGAPEFFMDLKFDRNGTMYGVTSTVNPSYTPAKLYKIDPTSGEATKVLNLVGSNLIMGLAFGQEGRMYATDNDPNVGLYLVDPATGFERAIAALDMGNIGFSSGLLLANPEVPH